MPFETSFFGKEASGIHNASSQNIMKRGADSCKDFNARVVLYDGVDVFQVNGEHTATECNVR